MNIYELSLNYFVFLIYLLNFWQSAANILSSLKADVGSKEAGPELWAKAS